MTSIGASSIEKTARFTQNDGAEAPAATAIVPLSIIREKSQKVTSVVNREETISLIKCPCL